MKIVSVISLTQLAITAMATPQEVFNSLYEGSSYETGDAPVDLQVNGDLPSYLQGSIIHNGCGSFSVGERSLSHVFGKFSLFSLVAVVLFVQRALPWPYNYNLNSLT